MDVDRPARTVVRPYERAPAAAVSPGLEPAPTRDRSGLYARVRPPRHPAAPLRPEGIAISERPTPNATEVRRTWAATLDLAAEGRPVAFRRDDAEFALLPAGLLRELLRRAVPAPEVLAEDGGWTVVLPGHPVAADAATLEAALADFVSALRDYAADWDARLHRAPDHAHAAALVQHVTMSDDDTLLAWARGAAATPRSAA